jgi:hypothetical protein
MAIEQRKHPRMPGNNRAAVVAIGPASPLVMCAVTDISDGGAGLTFVHIGGIPDRFTLEIKGDANIRTCKVVWRTEPHRLGVAFDA